MYPREGMRRPQERTAECCRRQAKVKRAAAEIETARCSSQVAHGSPAADEWSIISSKDTLAEEILWRKHAGSGYGSGRIPGVSFVRPFAGGRMGSTGAG